MKNTMNGIAITLILVVLISGVVWYWNSTIQRNNQLYTDCVKQASTNNRADGTKDTFYDYSYAIKQCDENY